MAWERIAPRRSRWNRPLFRDWFPPNGEHGHLPGTTWFWTVDMHWERWARAFLTFCSGGSQLM